MRAVGALISLWALATPLLSASFHDDFAVVLIDAASEARLGAFPLDRVFLAKAIRQAADQGARGVVLKFFLDRPKTEEADLALSQALTNIPVLLQARIDDREVHPNPLPARFTLPQLKASTEISGQGGWIPLPRFSAHAADIGFVDFSSPVRVPLLEVYQARTVKSLVLCCLELATGQQGIIELNRSIKFRGVGLRIDDHAAVSVQLSGKDDLKYIPFHHFVAGQTPARQVKGKIVIMGYDGPKTPSIPTGKGPLPAHRFFIYTLQSVYEQLGK